MTESPTPTWPQPEQPVVPLGPPLRPSPDGTPAGPWSPADALPAGDPSGGPFTFPPPIPPSRPSEPAAAPQRAGGRRRGIATAAAMTAAVLGAGVVGGVVGANRNHTTVVQAAGSSATSAAPRTSAASASPSAAAPGASGTSGTGAAVASTSPTNPAANVRLGDLDVHKVLADLEPAVVEVISTLPQGMAEGTGFFIAADGELLTNAHVVNGATQVKVRLAGETTARAATVVGADTNADVALLKVTGLTDAPVAKLGTIKSTKVGDPVVAIGFALGLQGDPTVTSGIVSATDRSLEQLTGLIQTDAAINHGNSGGPLANAAGEVIGINTASIGADPSSSAQNIGFAITIDDALTIADQLRSGTTPASTGFLGVSTTDGITGDLGAQVEQVSPNTPAASAGVQAGDLITALDDQSVTGSAQLGRLIRAKGVGAKVTLTIVRDGKTITLPVTLGSRSG